MNHEIKTKHATTTNESSAGDKTDKTDEWFTSEDCTQEHVTNQTYILNKSTM